MGGAEWDRLNSGGSSDLSSPSHTEMPVERSPGVATCRIQNKNKAILGAVLGFYGVGGLFGLSPCYCVDTIHYSFRSAGGDAEILCGH